MQLETLLFGLYHKCSIAHQFFLLGIVYGFNVTASKEVEQLSNRVGIPIKKHNVIYKLVDDIKVSYI